eukprot:CAMPEP_0116552016 /NCGR_PEP_ID=MMETSP0397-20121206/6261_1 /TAXON_ID=216820 /ORGANISM="Cyclophora tenuis, Strain ECT3854" /LENGTH=66 /DNA_ID=CAMNT_0004076937 /DNA_START=672 /DNA_END=872 /DNA_ORIENTATION=-
MPRSRVRGVTLHQGTRFHQAFFGRDSSARENFDQKELVSELSTRHHDRKGSTSKVGRSLAPRYAKG